MNPIKSEQIPHIIHRQKDLEEAFLAEFSAGHYTLENPLVKLNPYDICPLTAMVLFETPVATEATIIVRGKEHPGDIRHTFPADKKHILPVYGLYADYENKLEIVLANGQKNTITLKTEPFFFYVTVSTEI